MLVLPSHGKDTTLEFLLKPIILSNLYILVLSYRVITSSVTLSMAANLYGWDNSRLVYPVPQYWRYYSLALSHWYIVKAYIIVFYFWSTPNWMMLCVNKNFSETICSNTQQKLDWPVWILFYSLQVQFIDVWHQNWKPCEILFLTE